MYESTDHLPQRTFSNSSTSLPLLGIPDDQVFPQGSTRVASSARIGPPPVPSFSAQAPAPQPPASRAVVRGSVPLCYEFVHATPPRATLYTLPFRLADIIDPTKFPISDSTTSEMSMKLYALPRLPKRMDTSLTLLSAACLHYPIDCSWVSH